VNWRPRQVPQHHRPTGSPLHQTTRQTGAGLLLIWNGMEHVTRLWEHEYDSEGANARRGKRGHHRAGCVHCQPVWSGRL